MISKDTTCCFTGHRPEKLAWANNEDDPRCIDLKTRLFDAVEAVYLSGIRHFISGMAKGGDFFFCEAVLELRIKYPDITLEAAIPWEHQSSGWSGQDKRRYEHLRSQCDYETIITEEYTRGCEIRRNEYMVDQSSVLIAAYNGSTGGTMRTYLYAIRQGIEIIELPVD